VCDAFTHCVTLASCPSHASLPQTPDDACRKRRQVSRRALRQPVAGAWREGGVRVTPPHVEILYKYDLQSASPGGTANKAAIYTHKVRSRLGRRETGDRFVGQRGSGPARRRNMFLFNRLNPHR
jgi:hypothetical protein